VVRSRRRRPVRGKWCAAAPRSALGHRNLPEQIPDEPDELAGERNVDLWFHDAAAQQVPAALVQAHLRLPGSGAIDGGLIFLPQGERRRHFWWIERMLHRLNQNPAGLGIARLGDGAEVARVAGRILARHQAEIGHESARVREAPHLVQFGHEQRSGHQLETTEAHQRLHGRVHPPLRHLGGDQFLVPGELLGRLRDREQILLEDRFERRQRQYPFAQITLMRLAPVGLAFVVKALAQEKRLQPLAKERIPCGPVASEKVLSMSSAELRKLPPAEKLKIIETLWADLAADEESFSSPAWHEDELRKTEAEFAAGRIEILDWENAKKELRKRFE
jgi:hypothetical protein